MFDLEQSIANWREQMRAAGIKTPVPLEELEIHLREEIERQMESECDGQKVFDVAIRKIGEASTLETEFTKIGESIMNAKRRKLFGIALVVGTIVVSGLLQIFSDSFISVHRHGIHGAIIIHWAVFLMVALNLAGLVCLLWPTRRTSRKVN
jgi:hypothetical protein